MRKQSAILASSPLANIAWASERDRECKKESGRGRKGEWKSKRVLAASINAQLENK